MEKILQENLKQAYKLMYDFKLDEALKYFKTASLTLKKLIQNPEISQDEKDRLYIYHDEILSRIGICYFLKNPPDNQMAYKAFQKVKDKTDYIEVAEGVCALKLVGKGLDGSVVPEIAKVVHKVDEIDLNKVDDPFAQIVFGQALWCLAEGHYAGAFLGDITVFADDEERAIKYISTLQKTGWLPHAVTQFQEKHGISIPPKPVESPKTVENPKPVESPKQEESSEFDESMAKIEESIALGENLEEDIKSFYQDLSEMVEKMSEPKQTTLKQEKAKMSRERKITIQRTKKNFSALAGAAVPFEVVLDGAVVGTLSLGQEISFNVDEKSHSLQIWLRNALQKTFGTKGIQSDIFTIPSGFNSYVYAAETKADWGNTNLLIYEVGSIWDNQQIEKFDVRDHVGTLMTTKALQDYCVKILREGVRTVGFKVSREYLSIYHDGQVVMYLDWKDLTKAFEPRDRFTVIDDKKQQKEMQLMIHEAMQKVPFINCMEIGKYCLK